MYREIVFGTHFNVRVWGARIEAALSEQIEDSYHGAIRAVFDGNNGVVVLYLVVCRRGRLDGGEYVGEGRKRM